MNSIRRSSRCGREAYLTETVVRSRYDQMTTEYSSRAELAAMQQQRLTKRLKGVLDEVDVRLLDHRIAANMEISSLAQLGHIKSDYHV